MADSVSKRRPVFVLPHVINTQCLCLFICGAGDDREFRFPSPCIDLDHHILALPHGPNYPGLFLIPAKTKIRQPDATHKLR